MTGVVDFVSGGYWIRDTHGRVGVQVRDGRRRRGGKEGALCRESAAHGGGGHPKSRWVSHPPSAVRDSSLPQDGSLRSDIL